MHFPSRKTTEDKALVLVTLTLLRTLQMCVMLEMTLFMDLFYCTI